MKVSINGLGNIGTTLALVLQKYKSDIGISEVFAFKNKQNLWQESDLAFLKEKGIKIITSEEIDLEAHIRNVDFVFDTTSNGMAIANKSIYNGCKTLKGAIAQGSEIGFGLQFMSGLPIDIKNEKFIQIVSCNTHAAAAILSLFDSMKLLNTKMADFVVVRRSEDLGNHTRLVTANVVARHLSDITGTHHGIDVKSMFSQLGLNCPITSSDITTPSQLMHATRFHIETAEPLNWEIINETLKNNPLLSTTKKFDSNYIFELGRRYGDFGRIFSHVILVENNIIKTPTSVKGWAFVPQEGNTIISTIEAFLRMVHSKNVDQKIMVLKKALCKQEW